MFHRHSQIAAATILGLVVASRVKGETGTILGIPYDWRRPTVARAKSRWWNPDEPHLFVPRVFGIGWISTSPGFSGVTRRSAVSPSSRGAIEVRGASRRRRPQFSQSGVSAGSVGTPILIDAAAGGYPGVVGDRRRQRLRGLPTRRPH